MAQWKETTIDASLLLALFTGFSAAVLVGVAIVGWIDDRIDARLDFRMMQVQQQVQRVEARTNFILQQRQQEQQDTRHMEDFR